MPGTATESALLLAARQLADEARERSLQARRPRRRVRPARLSTGGPRVPVDP